MSNPTELPDLDLNELEAIALAATPGPWKGDRYDGTIKYDLLGKDDETVIHGDNGNSDHGPFGIENEEDANYLLTFHPATALRLIELARRTQPEVAQQAAAPLDCSGTPSSCPDNEGYGCHCSAPGTPEAPKPPFPISDDEMSALRRFWECATDGEGYDVEKAMMQRLAEMGLVQRKSGAYYMATEFGLYVLGEYTVERATQLDGGQEGSAT